MRSLFFLSLGVLLSLTLIPFKDPIKASEPPRTGITCIGVENGKYLPAKRCHKLSVNNWLFVDMNNAYCISRSISSVGALNSGIDTSLVEEVSGLELSSCAVYNNEEMKSRGWIAGKIKFEI